MVILHKDQYTFMFISCSVFLRMRNVLGKSCRDVQWLSPELWGLWDKVEKYGRARQATDDSIIRHISFEWQKTEATDTQIQTM